MFTLQMGGTMQKILPLFKIIILFIFCACIFFAGIVTMYYKSQRDLILLSMPLEFSPDRDSNNCPKNAMVIGIFGQSNSMSYPEKIFPVDHQIFEYIPEYDLCIRSDSRFSKIRGNAIYGAAKQLRDNEVIDRPVVISSWGVGGTSILQWSSNGLADKSFIALDRLSRRVGSVRFVFFHQGERDAVMTNRLTGMNGDLYFQHLNSVISNVNRLAPRSRIGIALATNCGLFGGSDQIRHAQMRAIRNYANAFLSADTDLLEDRPDGCHLSKNAIQKLGSKYYASMTNQIGRHF
jgi:hypothetical protein